MTTISADTAAQINPDVWKKYKLGPLQRLWRLVVGLIGAHVGTLIIVAIYYIAFETNASATSWWHHTVSNGDLRHTIRDVAEGVLGAFLFKAVIYNHFTKKHINSGRIYDSIKRKTHIPESIMAIGAALLTFVVLFAAGYAVLEALHVHSVHAASGGVWANTQALWTDGYVNKILAFVCAIVGVRFLHAMYDDIQGYFAQRRAHTWTTTAHQHGKPWFFYPGNFKNRFRYLVDYPAEQRDFAAWVPMTMRVLFFVGFGLAVYGWYILAYIA